jgi:hypothetical protein
VRIFLIPFFNPRVCDPGLTRPCFQSIGVGSRRAAPVTHQVQGFGNSVLYGQRSPAPGSSSAPENCRCHAVSKVIGFTNPLAHPLGASNPMLAHGVGVPSDQIVSELSRFQGRSSRQSNLVVLNQPLCELTAPSQPLNLSLRQTPWSHQKAPGL